MQQIESQCTSCGAFSRRSLHHEEEYQSSVLLERLRTTNSPATDEQISHVRHTILPTISDDISSIESKISSLREVIRSMEEEREKLINVQKKYHNLVSLHRALPSELWSEIFLYTLSSDSDSNAFDASGPIWRLSHVCQKWRNIALSLHSFWSTIDIHFPEAARQEGDVQRLETIIQRSRQRPLDVSLQSGYILAPSADPSILQRIIDILLAESYRWQKLHLSDVRGRLNMLYAPLYNRLPRLESLSLDCVQIEPKEQSVFKDCPRLTKLTLGGSPLVTEFPWDQITELDLYHIDFDGSEEGLRAYDEVVSPYPPTTCPNVRKLDTLSVRVLDALTLPRLQEASFHPHSTRGHHDALYVFEKLLIRSHSLSALTSLSLGSVPLVASPHHTLHAILSQTPNLTFLNLDVIRQEFDDQTDFSDRDQVVMIVESLAVIPMKAVSFLPLLSSLGIWIYNERDWLPLKYFRDAHNFASMVQARWEGDDTIGLAKLRTCHFAVQVQGRMHRAHGIISDIFNEAERLILNALIDGGMDLHIRVSSDWT